MDFFLVYIMGGVIIGQVRLGQVHRPTIVFLPLLFRFWAEGLMLGSLLDAGQKVRPLYGHMGEFA